VWYQAIRLFSDVMLRTKAQIITVMSFLFRFAGIQGFIRASSSAYLCTRTVGGAGGHVLCGVTAHGDPGRAFAV
jgi:hypothetical protein